MNFSFTRLENSFVHTKLEVFARSNFEFPRCHVILRSVLNESVLHHDVQFQCAAANHEIWARHARKLGRCGRTCIQVGFYVFVRMYVGWFPPRKYFTKTSSSLEANDDPRGLHKVVWQQERLSVTKEGETFINSTLGHKFSQAPSP